MISRFPPHLGRNSEALSHLEAFLIAGVVSFLGIRALLGLTDYPRIGGGGLHIAHMPWGGCSR